MNQSTSINLHPQVPDTDLCTTYCLLVSLVLVAPTQFWQILVPAVAAKGQGKSGVEWSAVERD